MRSGITVLTALILAVLIASGVAGANAASSTVDPGGGASVPADEGAIERDKNGNGPAGYCENNRAPQCFRPKCPDEYTCPAQDQCYGAITCGVYTTMWGTHGCRMLGYCTPDTTRPLSVVIN